MSRSNATYHRDGISWDIGFLFNKKVFFLLAGASASYSIYQLSQKHPKATLSQIPHLYHTTYFDPFYRALCDLLTQLNFPCLIEREEVSVAAPTDVDVAAEPVLEVIPATIPAHLETIVEANALVGQDNVVNPGSPKETLLTEPYLERNTPSLALRENAEAPAPLENPPSPKGIEEGTNEDPTTGRSFVQVPVPESIRYPSGWLIVKELAGSSPDAGSAKMEGANASGRTSQATSKPTSPRTDSFSEIDTDERTKQKTPTVIAGLFAQTEKTAEEKAAEEAAKKKKETSWWDYVPGLPKIW